MICERCGKKFNKEDAKDEFEAEMTPKIYDHLEKKLCGKCAIEAIYDLENGIYFEYCDRCRKKYYPLDDNAKFESMHSNEYGTYAYISDLSDEFLCLDCAIDEYNK